MCVRKIDQQKPEWERARQSGGKKGQKQGAGRDQKKQDTVVCNDDKWVPYLEVLKHSGKT